MRGSFIFFQAKSTCFIKVDMWPKSIDRKYRMNLILLMILSNGYVRASPYISRRQIREIHSFEENGNENNQPQIPSTPFEYNDEETSQPSLGNLFSLSNTKSIDFYDEDNDLVGASSTHILSLVKKKYKNKSPPPTSTSPSTSSTTEISATMTSEIAETGTTEMFGNSTSTEKWYHFTENNDSSTEYEIKNETGTENYGNRTADDDYEFQATTEFIVPVKNLKIAVPYELLNTTADSDEDAEEKLHSGTVIHLDSKVYDDTSDSEEPDIDYATPENTNAPPTDGSTEKENYENFDRSVENLETSDEYKGEQTTVKNPNSSSIISEEDASIESDDNDSNLEANDMVFLIDLSNVKDEENETVKIDGNSNDGDVETINADELQKNTTILPEKSITKRESKSSDDDSVFFELNQELGLISTTVRPKSEEEEKIESMKIFKELLEELKNPGKKREKTEKTPEDEKVEKITNALGKLLLKGSLDLNVLNVLREFFSSQNKAYDNQPK